MEDTPQGEQHPDEALAVAVYERMLQLAPQADELKIDERARRALADYPDPTSPPAAHPQSSPETPLELKFRHFAQTFLGTSANIEVFYERTSFLYSPEFLEYYAQVAKQPRQTRLVDYAGRAVDIGTEGLTDFCEQHPEDRAEALEYIAIAFTPDRATGFKSATSVLANIVGTEQRTFQEQWNGGYFQDVAHTPKQLAAAECLAKLGFGNLPRTIGSAAIHGAVYAPLTIERLYHLRNFNTWLTERVDSLRQGEPPQLQGYEGSNITKLYGDAYEMLRRATKYVAEFGSVNAMAILEALPELQRGQPPARARVIALANALTPQMNEAYFKNEFVLDRLDGRSDEAQLQAFDRILYVLYKELPNYGLEKFDTKHQTTLTLVGDIVSGLIDLVYLKMDARNPVTIGDIITMYPDADPETLQTIIEGMQTRFERGRSAPYRIYLDYRDQVRKARAMRFKSKRSGFGIIS